MENRRLFTFLLLSVATVWLWGTLVAPKLFPPQQLVPDAAEIADDDTAIAQPDDAKNADVVDTPPAEEPVLAEADDKANQTPPTEGVPPVHPLQTVVLGSLDPESGFALQLTLSSAGAAIEDVLLTDPQFRELRDGQRQAKIVGNNSSTDRSFSLAVDRIDSQLKKHGPLTLETISWKLEEQTSSEEGMSARFSFEALDGSMRLQKIYTLPRLQSPPAELHSVMRTDPSGYTIRIEILAENLSQEPQQLTYELQGPVGILLENEEHTSKYRDIKIEFLSGGDDATRTPKEVVNSVQEIADEAGKPLSREEMFAQLREKDKWTGVFRYAGIDVQFFAALVAPLDDRSPAERLQNKWIDRTYPMVVEKDRRDSRKSDISFRMVSSPIVLESRDAEKDSSVSHRYAFFVGPKRRELLDPLPLEAARVLDYGSYFGFIARGMHWVLDRFYSMGMPYVLAIISLTVLVRGCMFPLSRKQAISAAKMKELQPRLVELKEKFGDDKEKLARAQMDLWRKHKINPLGGCLPLVFQLPIFIGLYTSLNTAVDLRLSRFLWIENLAAPDALFRLPFEMPFGLGADFSLLPCLTVGLFLWQQKLFMPPAMDEQQQAQQKMMNIMTIFMGVMFWHQPAGLCVYFIASSLWGIAERKMLGTVSLAPVSLANGESSESEHRAAENTPSKASVKVVTPKSDGESKVPGFMQKLMDMAEEAKDNAEKSRRSETRGKKKRNR